MPLTRRYVFHGHAAALGGRIVRIGDPKKGKPVSDAFIDLPGSVLTVAGGQSTAELSPEDLKHPVVRSFVRFTSARTHCLGSFANQRGHYESTISDVDAADLEAVTTVSAEVRDLRVGLDSGVRLQADRVFGGFSSTGARPGRQTPVALDPGTGFGEKSQIVFLDERDRAFTLRVVLDLDTYNASTTQAGLVGAAKKARFLAEAAQLLHLKPSRGKATAPPKFKRTDSGDIVATIVKELAWENNVEFPGARFDKQRRNRVHIPGLGLLSLGELLIGTHSRRLTMIRGELGSPMGVDFAAVDVQDNGGLSF